MRSAQAWQSPAAPGEKLWSSAASEQLLLDFGGNRTAGVFTDPPAPADPLTWFVVGPR